MVDVKIDDRKAFYAWVNAGSLEKATLLLANEGSYNQNTGANWCRGSIKQAANRFILYNTEEARQVYKDCGSQMNEKQWNVKVLRSACRTLSRKSFAEWLKQNVWALEFPQIIENRFPGLIQAIEYDKVMSQPDPDIIVKGHFHVPS